MHKRVFQNSFVSCSKFPEFTMALAHAVVKRFEVLPKFSFPQIKKQYEIRIVYKLL